MKHVLVVTIMLTVAKCFHEGRRIKYTQPNTGVSAADFFIGFSWTLSLAQQKLRP